MAETAGLTLSAEDLRAIAALAGRMYVNDRVAGLKVEFVQFDQYYFSALNRWLVLAGRDPLPMADFAAERSDGRACDEDEPGFEREWSVQLRQDETGRVQGALRFHNCPGGGRVVYRVVGFATALDTIRLLGQRVGRRGELGESPSQALFWLTQGGAPTRAPVRR